MMKKAEKLSYTSLNNEDRKIIQKLRKYKENNQGSFLVFSPGRGNITEYMDMLRSSQMSFAIQKGIWSISEKRKDNYIKIILLAYEKTLKIDIKKYIIDIKNMSRSMTWKEFAWKYPNYKRSQGDPFNYIIAPIIRIMFSYQEGMGVNGYNLIIDKGNLPPDAGLSSSSSIVVNSAYQFILNNPHLDIKKTEWERLMGESEWFVGTRGGFNDHITINRGKKSNILINCYEEKDIKTRYIKWKERSKLIIYNTNIKSNKTSNSLAKFNEIKKQFIHTANMINYPLGTKRYREIGQVSVAEIFKYLNKYCDNIIVNNILRFYLFQRIITNAIENNLMSIGKNLYLIHCNMVDKLKNSLEEMEKIVFYLSREKGINGAKMLGAGFGGAILISYYKEIDFPDIIKRVLYKSQIKDNYKQRILYEYDNKEIEKNIIEIEISDGLKCFYV